MHKSQLALAFLAAVSIIVTAQADDFSALLADLKFDDTPAVNETLTLTDPPEQQQLRAAPTELAMPELDVPAVSVPAVSLQEPVAAEAPQTAAQIDLDAAFSLQESAAGVDAQSACFLLDHDKKGSCDEGFCEEGIVCTPHTAPNLPSSSFYQYFRSNKCNSHVWDGYRQHCRSSNKHVNGTCDCFKEKPKKKRAGCAPILECQIVECTDCNVRPRRKILPVKKSCNDCTTCEPSCESGCDTACDTACDG